MKVLKKILFSLFLLTSLSYLFIIISPKIIKGFYPFGIKTAIVLTGSMEPTLKINDFVIMKKPNDIKVNDIISYRQINSDNEVLHRVIRINNNVIITKGDANNTEDKPIDINQVTGIYIGKIKYLGNITFFIQKNIIFSSIITLFFIIMLIPSKKTPDNIDNKKKNDEKENKMIFNEDEKKLNTNIDNTKISNIQVIDNSLKDNKLITNKNSNTKRNKKKEN